MSAPAAFSIHQIIEEFRHAMTLAGVPYSGDIKEDSEDIRRFTVDGDRKNSMTGWYILHTDGVPAGEFGCWKRGVQQTWCAKRESTMTPEELAELARKRQADGAQRKAAQDARHAAAADEAANIWAAATPCESHPYLTRKGVPSHGLRVGRWTRSDDAGEIWLDVPDALLIPIRSGKKIVSLQAIFPSKDRRAGRDKDFLSGGRKRGGFFFIGAMPADGVPAVFVVCEGYATGATIHAATGFPVLVAFDAGNLESVALKVRQHHWSARIIIAADNDRWTEKPIKNPGVAYASRAAQLARGELVIPEFSSLDSKPTDFNDLAQLDGIDAVRRAFTMVGDDEDDGLDIFEDEPASKPPANDNAASAPAPAKPAATGYCMDAVDWYSPFPDVNGNGKPIGTIENLAEACRRLRVTIRYNVITKEIEILIPGEGFSVDNCANASLSWLESCCIRFGLPTAQLGGYLCYLADRNQYNPVAEWIVSKPWDGQERLQALISTIKAQGEEDDLSIGMVKELLLRRWMISAVAAAFEPSGVSAHGVLVLQGDQYLGKTAWFKSLVPPHLGVIQDGLILRPDDRDSVKQAVSNWLVELGELDATFRKSDIAQLKAFITRDHDTLRRAYAKLESHYARRTVFFASVNPRQFLHDPTGNRRYWTISCAAINHQHGLDMQQVWAEVLEIYRSGEPWRLTADEVDLLNNHNKDFEVLDPVKERLQTRYNWDAPTQSWRWMTATDIMLELGFDRPGRADVTHCGQLVLDLNGRQSKKSNGRKLSFVPPKRDHGEGRYASAESVF